MLLSETVLWVKIRSKNMQNLINNIIFSGVLKNLVKNHISFS